MSLRPLPRISTQSSRLSHDAPTLSSPASGVLHACRALGLSACLIGPLFGSSNCLAQASNGNGARSGQAQTPAAVPQSMPTEEELTAATAVLASPTAEDELRRAAATTVVAAAAMTDWQKAAVRRLIEALGPGQPVASRAAVADQVARQGTMPPRSLTPALSACVDVTHTNMTIAALRALARFQARDAVRPVLDGLLGPATGPLPPAVTAQAFETLTAQTGLTQFGADLEAWRLWWANAQWLSEQDWRTQIGRSQAQAAESLRRQRADATRLIVDLYRRLHAGSPEASRSDMLAEMMGSTESEVRRLGVELTLRALLNGKSIDDTIAGAVANRLKDPVAAIRAEAATVLDRLNRPAFWRTVKDALLIERHPEVATALLRAAMHEADAELVVASLRWLRAGAPASESAIAALLAAHEAKVFDAGEVAEDIRMELAQLYPDRLTPSALRLMVKLGDDAQVVALLNDADESRALMAAGALAEDEDSLDSLVAAARIRSALRELTVGALARWRPTANGFATAAEFSSWSDAAGRAGLIEFARSLPAGELLEVARAERDAERREALISHTVAPEYLARPGEPTDRIDLLVLTLQTRLALGRPADALAALDATPTEWMGPRLRALRVTALLCLDRVEDASDYTKQSMEIGADTAMLRAWVDALAYTVDRPFARRVREALLAMYPEVQNSPEASRFHDLSQRIPESAPTPPVPDDNGGASENAEQKPDESSIAES